MQANFESERDSIMPVLDLTTNDLVTMGLEPYQNKISKKSAQKKLLSSELVKIN